MNYDGLHYTELRHKGPRRGTKALHDAVLLLYGTQGVRSGGIYNRRKIAGSQRWSLHAVGRAVDFWVPNKAVGDRLALSIVRIAERIGVCEIIWWDWRWTPNEGVTRWTKPDHRDHVHVAQTRKVADNESSHADLVRFFVAGLQS